MNTNNIAWGIALIASSILGLAATSCTSLPEVELPEQWPPAFMDGDNDGFAGAHGFGRDCDDGDPATYPGAPELCDGKDNNCDLQTDEGASYTWWRDNDGDGQGDPAVSDTGCLAPDGYVDSDEDCDDNDVETYRGAPELCDAKDNNCDGVIDDGLETAAFYLDADHDSYGDRDHMVLSCRPPADHVDRWGDCNDSDAAINPEAAEQCNGRDDDCDEAVDDGLLQAYYKDTDSDGFGTGVWDYIMTCVPVVGRASNNWDCNDNDQTINPAVPEYCNTRDDNCNRAVDEQYWAFTQTPLAYHDSDRDGYGDPSSGFYGCLNVDDVLTAGDCDDLNAAVNPDVPEMCNGLDDDCNGLSDEVNSATGTSCSP